MLFTSVTFAVFFIVVFLLYWFVFNKNTNDQNLLLLLASYVFYGWWDWRFLFILFISSLVDYLIGVHLAETENAQRRKLLLGISLVGNLGALGVFKYYNFFVESLVNLTSNIGVNLNINTLSILLPIGISFYTFQTLSYTIDVYKGKQQPSRDILAFLTFVSFFPQLVAGPIERASSLLPQFQRIRTFKYINARDGMQQILWGLFKKVWIADLLLRQVDEIFTNYTNLPGSTLVLGAVFFAFQTYCDFSAYSDIAIGTAKLLDFHLMTNFSTPYFSRNAQEFWRRWHISLSTWFRDYVYFPLGGSYGGKIKTIINILITFTVSGLWHGANWTFVIWGFLNGLYYVPTVLYRDSKDKPSKNATASAVDLIQIAATFTLITFAWIFFRSDSLSTAFSYINRITSWSLFTFPSGLLTYLIPIVILVAVEWSTRDAPHPLRKLDASPVVLRWSAYLLLAMVVVVAYREEKSFVYFEF